LSIESFGHGRAVVQYFVAVNDGDGGDSASCQPLDCSPSDKAHAPPTSWYADWVSGLDVFPVERDQTPLEIRWLVFRKTR
jgi:hypothetical protein